MKTLRLLFGIALFAAMITTSQAQNFLTNGLVGYWPFNGNDASGNNLNGTINGATLTADRFGRTASAYGFNGINNSISINSSPSLQLATNLTISFWMKFTNNGAGGMIICKGNGESAYSVGGTPGGIGFNHQNVNNMVLSQPSPSNVWFQTVCTMNGTNARIYFNGQLNKVGIGETLGTGTGALTIGMINSAQPSYFAGLLDDFRIYNRALSSNDVAALYALEFPDADKDGLSDYEEINVLHTNPNKRDTDDDGLSDYEEVRARFTNPIVADTDGDGFNDYAEIYTAHDPLLNTDYPAANLSAFTAIELEFVTKVGTTYQLQTSPDLVTWTNFDSAIIGDGNLWKKTYPTRGQGRLFHRVESAP